MVSWWKGVVVDRFEQREVLQSFQGLPSDADLVMY